MEEIIRISLEALPALISAVVLFACRQIIKQLSKAAQDRQQTADDQRKRDELVGDALKVILYALIDDACSKAFDRGETTLSERENVTYLYDAYKLLKGNHGIDDKYEQFELLPVKC